MHVRLEKCRLARPICLFDVAGVNVEDTTMRRYASRDLSLITTKDIS